MEVRKRILAIDDDPLVLDLIQDILSEEYDVEAMSDPKAALAALDHEEFDLLIVDLGLSGTDGVEVIRQVRAAPRRRDIPIIVMSAYDELRRRVAGLDVQGIIRKPFRLEAFNRCIEKCTRDLSPAQRHART